MREIRLSRVPLTDEEAAALEGTKLDDSSYDQLLEGEDVAVYKPDGSLLLKLVTGKIDQSLARTGYKALRNAARPSRNRGTAAGKPKLKDGDVGQGNFRFRPMKQDGTISNRNYATEVESGVVGFVDRYTTYPYCRQTAFTMEKPQLFQDAIPLIQRVNELFMESVPDRYENQWSMIEKTHPHFYIHGTVSRR
jgi:hypothetical protein